MTRLIKRIICRIIGCKLGKVWETSGTYMIGECSRCGELYKVILK